MLDLGLLLTILGIITAGVGIFLFFKLDQIHRNFRRDIVDRKPSFDEPKK